MIGKTEARRRGSTLLAAIAVVGLFGAMAACSDDDDIIIPAGSVLPIALGLLYFGYFESSTWQATLGKRALGIYVTGMDGERISAARAVGRHLASWISDAVFLAGYLIQLFTPKRQALHDIIAGTLVLR